MAALKKEVLDYRAAGMETGVHGDLERDEEIEKNSIELYKRTGDMMKIAISAQGPDLESLVDPRFGRAEYFILYDTEEEKHEVVDNRQNAASGQGAGVVTAQTVIKLEPDLIISGNLGPKAFQVLSSAGVKSALWSGGSVSEAIELAKNNQLKFADGANVAGHWM